MNADAGALSAMVLCAGLGTRLRPLTEERAKPMVPVGDSPAVAHVVARVRLASSRIAVNVFHQPADLLAWAEREGVLVSEEEELLGTAGGVEHAASLLGRGDVLVWNGDILSDLDPRALALVHHRGSAVATLAVMPRAAGEGNVGIAADGAVVRLRKESFASLGEEVRGGEFLGIHVLGRMLRDELPEKGCLVGDVYIPALAAGERIQAFETSPSFTDIGSLARYIDANRAWLAARSLASWVAADAVVAGGSATVAGSVIGAGARIDAPTLRSVVWPGAHVTAPVEDAVVTTRGTIARYST